jgi:hypothetical protein
MRRSTILAAVLFAAVVASAASVAHGVYVTTLDTLLPGGANSGGVSIGGVRFSGFAFRSDGPLAVSPADVMVRISDNEVIPEGPPKTIEFRYGVDALAGQTGSAAIDYRADLLSAWQTMNRVGVRFNGSVPSQGVGGGSTSNLLTVSSVDGSDVAVGGPARDAEVLDIFNDGPGRLDDSNSDFLSVNPISSLRLSNAITLSARDTARLELSTANNFLILPEPSAAALIALPSALALLARRRRRVSPASHHAP